MIGGYKYFEAVEKNAALLGLLTLQLLGDEVIAQRWEELPEVLTSLLFDGLQLGKETNQQ